MKVFNKSMVLYDSEHKGKVKKKIKGAQPLRAALQTGLVSAAEGFSLDLWLPSHL